MEIGPITRPSPSNVGPVSRVPPAAPTAPVRVDIPKIAVEQAPKPPKPRPDPQPKAPVERADAPVTETRRGPVADPDSVDRRITIDATTQQVIYQTIDKDSGEIVRQIPEETMLRLQVYARAMRQAAAKPEFGVETTA